MKSKFSVLSLLLLLLVSIQTARASEPAEVLARKPGNVHPQASFHDLTAADSHLLVVSQGHTARRTMANCKEMLAEMNVIGVVLNRSTEHNDSPYY